MKYFYSLLLVLFLAGFVGINAQNTWYTLASGDWDNSDIWTLDPAGAILVNPNGEYPDDATDNVVIKTGKVVTVPLAVSPDPQLVLSLGTVTVDGSLKLLTTTGHTFDVLRGSGKIFLQADNFPTVTDVSDFITEGKGEGTVVFEGSSFSFGSTQAYTFYNLEVEMTSTTDVVTLVNDLTLNGNLLVAKGKLQINDDANDTTPLTVDVMKNITVQSGGAMTVGTADVLGTSGDVHRLNVYGDFKNYGTITFTNTAQYLAGTAGAVNINFTGTSDNVFVSNGTTTLYRMFLSKGTDRTYTLSVSADDQNNFSLYGPISDSDGIESADGAAGWQRLALVINTGTLKLGSNINIPSLCNKRTGVDPRPFSVPLEGQLWIDGATIATSNNTGGQRGITLLGKLKVSDGTFTASPGTEGIKYYGNDEEPCALEITGGDVYTTQIKRKDGTGRFSYIQSGGEFHIEDLSNGFATSAVFSLEGTNDYFEMSGGKITIKIATTDSPTNGIDIQSELGNYNITGGEIEIITPVNTLAGLADFQINSTVPFYDFKITDSGSSGSNSVVLQHGFTVLNDLTIGANTEFDASGYDLSVGGDFTVEAGGTFTHGSNTTIFNGEENSSISNGGASAVLFYDLKLNKDAIFDTVTVTAGDFQVSNNLTLNGGTLNTDDETPSIKGNIEILKGQIVNTGIGALLIDGTTLQTLKGAAGKEQEFGSIELNNSSFDLKLVSDINVSDFTFTSGMVNLDTHNLTISGTLTGAGASNYFYTTGISSDRGLTLGFSMSGTYPNNTTIATFPVGISTSKYTPVTVKADGTTVATSGFLTVIPVSGAHPATINASRSLDFYWKTRVGGFANLTNGVISMEFNYGSSMSPQFWESFLDGQTWTWKQRVSGTTLFFDSNDAFNTFIDGDFTAGNQGVFRRIDVFYSRQSGVDWFSGNAWLDENYNTTTATPGRGDIAVIRNGHRINVASGSPNIDIGMLEFEHDTAISTDLEDLPRLQIQVNNTVTLDRVKGTGIFTQWINNTSDPSITGDFGEFIDEKYSWFLFVASASTVDIPNQWTLYPNVMTEGGGNTLTFTEDVTILGDFNPRGNSTILMNSGLSGDIYIGGDLLIGDYLQGKLEFASTGSERTLTIEGDIDFTQSVSTPTNAREIGVLNTTPSTLEHKIILGGDIIQGVGVLDLGNTSASDNNVSIVFTGDISATVSKDAASTEITDFYKIEIDKPEGQKVEFTGDFTLSGAADGSVKPLLLTSGECHLNNSAINIALSTGGNDFRILSGTTLRVDNGATVNVGGSTSNTGIWLDGSLIIDNSGIINCNQGSSGFTDNYIEYSSSGNASIWLGNGAELKVGSQIRRSLNTDVGILSFTQDNSTSSVVVGANASGNTSRGLFEILGTGSSFTQAADAKLTIARGHGADYVSLYFDPETVSLGSGSGFVIGDDIHTPASQNIAVYAGTSMMNFEINATNTPTATLKIVPLTLDEDLTIGTNAEFDAYGLDVILKGDIISSGTYTANSNTTYIEGTSDQAITGNVTFYNLIKHTTSNTLTLNDNIVVENNLNMETGTLNTGDYDVSVLGNLNNEITTSSNSGSKGIRLIGSDTQELTGGGTFSVLTINNTNGVVIPTQSGSVNLTDKLRMADGVLDIGRNLLVLQENAIIEPVNPFSETNMIQTNLSFTDNGIQKFLPLISSSTIFTYPIGSLGKYTPVILDISGNGNNTGAIRVKAADEPHVTVPSTQQDSVLQYYWTLDATGIEGFSAEAKMYFYQDDAIPVSDTANYYTAKLLLGTTTWEKYTPDDFNGGANNYLQFDIGGAIGTDDLGIDGDYTAGIAIPDDVPSYITVVDGDWTTTSTWATYDVSTGTVGSPGVDVPAGGPRGSIIYVANQLTLLVNGMSAYRTIINTIGSVITGSTFAHRLGDVSGTGSLVLESGDMPAGVYDEFFSVDGGTLEFTGTALNYDVMSEITQVNNLKFSGTGTRNFPNLDVQLVGDFIINGPNTVNLYDKTLSVKGDINFTAGNYDSRYGKLLMNGDVLQSIDGTVDFTSADGGALYDLEINSGFNVDIVNNIEVKNTLVFVNGVFNTSAGGILTITNSLNTSVVGGKSTSYVEGPLRKVINNSDYFVFPVGDALRYGEIRADVDGSSGGTWEAEYYNHSPGDDSMNPETIDATGNLAYVSHGEYWRVEAPATGNSANLTMRWDSNSGVNPNSDFTVARWTDLATDAWSEVTPDNVTGTTSSGTTNLLSNLTFGFSGSDNSHYITFGTISIPAYTWIGATSDWFTSSNWTNSTLPDASADVTINTVSIPNVYPVIDNSVIAQVHNLAISLGATLTLQPGARMTINGDLITNADDALIIQNTVAAPTSLIVRGATDVATVEWTYPENRYMYVGHSVDGVTYSDYSSAITDDVNNLWLYRWPSSWTRITSSAANNTGLSGAEHALEGYAVKSKQTGSVIISHAGDLRNGSYTSTAFNGYKLTANPYQSYIDLLGFGTDIGNADPTIWTSTNVTGELAYATFSLSEGTGANGGTRYVAPGQSFWIEHTTSSTVTVSPALRTFDDRAALKGVPLSSDDELRLSLINDGLSDEVVLLFRTGGTVDEVTERDSKKRMGSAVNVPNIYAAKGGEKIVIGVYPEVMEYDTVSLGYKFSLAKEITLRATNINDFGAVENVYLFDRATGIEINLRETPEYTFMSTSGEDADRFEVYFTHLTTGVSDIGDEGLSGDHIQIYGTGQKGIVKITEDILAEAQGKGIIRLYSAAGSKIKEFNLTDVKTIIDLPVNYGVYIIEVSTGERVVTGKVTRMK